MIPKLFKNIIYSIILPLIMLAVGFIVVFMIMLSGGFDPVVAYLPSSYTPSEYNTMKELLGFNDPLIFQFFRFVIQMFNPIWWGNTIMVPGMPATEIVIPSISESLSFTVLPIILGTGLGLLFGLLSTKLKDKILKLLFHIAIVLLISVPAIYLAFWNQLILGAAFDLFPTTGDPILPSMVLFYITTALMAIFFRSNFIERRQKHYLPSNALKFCLIINVIFTTSIILELIFNIHGLGRTLFEAIMAQDYYVLRAILVLMLFLSIVPQIFVNLGFTFYSFITEDFEPEPLMKLVESKDSLSAEIIRSDNNFGSNLKEAFIMRLKSPLTILGLIIVGFVVLVAIFPTILTPFSYEQANDVGMGSWDPPSPEHPLGQTHLGRDVLARLVYGIRTTLVIGIISSLIGLLGGLILGFVAQLHRFVKAVILAGVTFGFLLPTFVIVIALMSGQAIDALVMTIFIGIFLIPAFTLVFCKTEYKLRELIVTCITYLPLIMIFTVLFIETLSFVGFSDLMLIHLGADISTGRSYLFVAYWASLYPALTLNILGIGFFSLYYGLREPIVINFRRRK